MTPHDTSAKATEFHEATKHSYIRLQTDHYYLDWENKPILYKVYLASPPRTFPSPHHLTSAALSRPLGSIRTQAGPEKLHFEPWPSSSTCRWALPGL